MADLSGLHLLVTRPQAQAETWEPQLLALGAEITQLPALAIEPISDAAAQQSITDRVLQLDEYYAAIFVSQNAVSYGAEWIDRYWPQLPQELLLLAVGDSTAELLQQSLGSLTTIITPKGAMNSEALLALTELQTVTDKKVLIFRGQGGRPHLAEVLQRRGARVDYCELYHRQIPATIDIDRWHRYKNTHKQPITVVHSGETLRNLCHLVSTDDLYWLEQQPLLVPGERVAQQAKTQGFEQIIIADNATHESMTGALHDWRQ